MSDYRESPGFSRGKEVNDIDFDGPRGTRTHELAAVVALADAIFKEGMGPQFPTLFCEQNGEGLRTFWRDGQPAALVGVWRGTAVVDGRQADVAHIGAVCTRPEYRGQGLATRLLLEVLERLRGEGRALALISGGRGLYRRLGAEPFGTLLRCRVRPSAAPQGRRPAVDVATPAAVEPMAELHAREVVRYRRGVDDWRRLAAAKGYLPAGRGRSAVLVRRPGAAAPSAYLLLGRVRRPENPDAGPTVLLIDEFGGDREALWEALPAVLAEAGAEVAELLAQPGDGALRVLCQAAGAAMEPCRHQGTALVLDPDAFTQMAGIAAEPRPWPPLGGEACGARAAALLARGFAGGLQWPRTDGLNYI